MASNSDSSRNSRGRRFRNTARELVKRWRYRGHTGRLIRRHRALRSLDLRTSSIVHPLSLTAASIVLVILLRNLITGSWAGILRFWCDSTGVDAVVGMAPRSGAGWFAYEVPALRVSSPLPSGEALGGSLIVVCVSMLIAYLFFRRFLPLCYLIWAISFIQLSALAYFYFSPSEFPYSVGAHVSSSLEMTLMLLVAIPVMLAVAYYPLNFSLAKKIAITVLMLGVVGIFAPHLYACHIVFMTHFSVLYMPVLFTVFGLLPIILIVIAIYGWGMSWAQRY